MKLGSTIVILAALTCCVSGASAVEIKDITYNTADAGKVVFSHKVHLKKKSEKSPNVSCKSCHATPATSKKVTYTMADMEKGKSCGKCHTGQKAFSLSNCTGCHKVKEIAYKIKSTGTVLFSHTKHLKSMQCNACHTKLYATGANREVSMAEMEKGKSCGACHNGAKAFSIAKCDACHPTPREVVFKVKETGPTVFSHSKHVEMYKCNSCHTKLYAIGVNKPVSMAAMEKGKSCGACHNAKEAFSVAECQKCHPVKEIQFKVAKASNVTFSHTAHLNMYKCNDCHTGTFPLRTANKPVTMSEMQKSKSCGACHDGKSAFSVSGSCDSCHVRS
ncbi:MAG: cytochrome C [Geobacteraceae bacterium GWC2_58_44]|nr:MAG: cytochrome C [Geobacteraceae bacterium GWC2_58_44]HBG07922.1 cytochrome C [Geobacter sp.]